MSKRAVRAFPGPAPFRPAHRGAGPLGGAPALGLPGALTAGILFIAVLITLFMVIAFVEENAAFFVATASASLLGILLLTSELPPGFDQPRFHEAFLTTMALFYVPFGTRLAVRIACPTILVIASVSAQLVQLPDGAFERASVGSDVIKLLTLVFGPCSPFTPSAPGPGPWTSNKRSFASWSWRPPRPRPGTGNSARWSASCTTRSYTPCVASFARPSAPPWP